MALTFPVSFAMPATLARPMVPLPWEVEAHMVFVGIGKSLFHKFQQDDAMGGAAEMAFRFMFAIFPLLIFLAGLSSYIARWLGIENPTEEILAQAGEQLPSDVQSIIEPQLRDIFESQNAGLLTVTALTAIWVASSGTKTVMKTLNRVYEVEESRPFIKKQAVGVGLTVVGGLVFLAGAIVLVVGQAAGAQVAEWVGLEGEWSTIVYFARIPIVLALIAIAVGLVYWSAPNTDQPLKWVTWGGGLFVLMWIVATLGFGFYVSNFGSYNATYGSLGAVIILMTWLYLSSLLLIVGAEVNFIVEQRYAEGEAAEPVKDTAESDARARSAEGTRTAG